MSKIRAEVTISGRVQGVWFRQSTRNTACENNLTGWCRNNPDKSVSAVFEGEEGDVETVLKWCQRGPKLARVDNVEVKRSAPSGEFLSFDII